MDSFPNVESVCCSCTVLTVASQETGKVFWYSHLFKNFRHFVVIHTVKGFSIVNEAKVDVFLEFLCFFYDPVDAGNWSLVPLPFLDSTSGSSQFMYYWSLAWRIWGINLLACEVSAIVQELEYSLALPFLGIGLKTDFFSPVATAKFSKFAGMPSAALSQHHVSGFEIAPLEFHHLH